MNKRTKAPNPGSDEALDMGCTCPVLDNAHGKGWLGCDDAFWISEDCPIHAEGLVDAVDAAYGPDKEGEDE